MNEFEIGDESGNQQLITKRNQRHFRGREIRCSECEHVSVFDVIPHQCCNKDCRNEFKTGKDVLLRDSKIWWDDRILRNSRVLVIGCGAVGNEVVKTLVLIGMKKFTLVDFDVVEESNRARTVLFNDASMDAIKGMPPHFKVEVMKAGMLILDPDVEVKTIPKGVDDWKTHQHNEDVDDGKKDGTIIPVLTEDEMKDLAEQHDLAIIGTDGISPYGFFNHHCYSILPQVRGAMNRSGSSSVVSVTLPFVTGCLQCHDIKSSLVLRGDDGKLDWRRWNRAAGFKCKDVADEMGAASFAHANSVVASAMVAQAVLVLHGYPELKDSGLKSWPERIPAPSWDARLDLPTYFPQRSDETPVEFGFDEGMPECPACRNLYNDDFHFRWESFGFDEVTDTPRFNPDLNPFESAKPPPPKPKKPVAEEPVMEDPTSPPPPPSRSSDKPRRPPPPPPP